MECRSHLRMGIEPARCAMAISTTARMAITGPCWKRKTAANQSDENARSSRARGMEVLTVTADTRTPEQIAEEWREQADISARSVYHTLLRHGASEKLAMIARDDLLEKFDRALKARAWAAVEESFARGNEQSCEAGCGCCAATYEVVDALRKRLRRELEEARDGE